MPEYTISELKKLDDAGVRELLGLDDKVETFKKHLAEADALTGKARTIFEEKITRMLTPNVYPDELGYMIKSSQREAKPRTAKEEMNSCSCDILD